MAKIRVLIAEDEALTRCLLGARMSQEADLEVAAEVETGREAIEAASLHRPDVAIMDLNLPDINGIEAMERIARHAPATRFIVLTALSQLASLASSAGAFTCLNKGCRPEEVVEAIRAAHADASRPEEPQDDPVLEKVNRAAPHAGLTEREREVVAKLVTTNLAQGEIAAALSRERGERVTGSAVRHAQGRAMAKLGIQPATRASLIKYVLEAF
jgi:DNA-binding NarL/FixJ family response regulator